MADFTLEKIREIREEKKKQMQSRFIINDRVNVIVGMGDSGIKAGAKEVLRTFIEEFTKREMYDVVLKQVGVEEEYGVEPVVMVYLPEMGSVKYKEITPELVSRIIDEHIVKKKILKEFVHRKPFDMST